MIEKHNICPDCGKPLKQRQRGFLFSAMIGSLAGLAIGVGFVIYGFGIYAGFFHTMALIHEAAGTLLGLLAGLAIGFLRK